MNEPTAKDWIIVRLMRMIGRSSDRTLRSHPDFVKTCVHMFRHDGDFIFGQAPDMLNEEDKFIRGLIDDKTKLEVENAELRETLTNAIQALQGEVLSCHPYSKSRLVAEFAAKHGLMTINTPLTPLEPGDLSGYPQ